MSMGKSEFVRLTIFIKIIKQKEEIVRMFNILSVYPHFVLLPLGIHF